MHGPALDDCLQQHQDGAGEIIDLVEGALGLASDHLADGLVYLLTSGNAGGVLNPVPTHLRRQPDILQQPLDVAHVGGARRDPTEMVVELPLEIGGILACAATIFDDGLEALGQSIDVDFRILVFSRHRSQL